MNEKKLKLVMRFPNFCFAKGQQREKIRENIVFQTNLYIQKKSKGKTNTACERKGALWLYWNQFTYGIP